MGVLWGVIFIVSITLPVLDSRKLCFEVKGIISPVFTPVEEGGRLNVGVVLPYAQFLKDQDVDGVLVAGTTGEGPTLNVTDKKSLIDAWVQAGRSLQLSVTIQVGGIPLPDAQELAAYAEKAEADAIMTLPDLYYKPKTAKELVHYVQLIARAAPDTPVLYYHIPKYIDVDVDMIEFLRSATEQIPNFRGLKSDDFGTSLLLQDKLTKDQKIFVADSLFLAPAACMGFENFIMSEINLFPSLFRDVVYYGTRDVCRKARPLYRKLRRLRDVIIEGHEDNELAVLKEAMPMVTGINVGPIRPPEIRIKFEEVLRLERRLTEARIEIIDTALDDFKY